MKDETISKEMREKLDRLRGILPPLPLSDEVKKKLAEMRAGHRQPRSPYVEERLERLAKFRSETINS